MPGEEIGSAYATIGIKIDEAGLNAAKSKLSSSVDGLEGKFKSGLGSELSASFSGMASSMGPIGGALSAIGPAGIAAGAGIAVVGGAISSSVSVAANFEQSMSRVNSVLGGSAADFQTLSTAAREAGASSTFSASQAADALYFLASAGYSTQETTVALGSTLDLAASDGMDLGRAAEMVTGNLAVFGLGAEEAGRVTNLLAASAAASNSGVGQMGDALRVVGGTANALGMSVENTTAVLSVMANGGIKAAEAGHKLNSILGELSQMSGSTATKAQATALSELGISADQVNPSLHSMEEIMTLLQSKGMTAAQALQLFGKENQSASLYIAANADSIGELETKITGTNKASEMAATQTDNYAGAMSEFSGACEEAQIAVGTLLLPTLTDLTKVMTGVVNGTVETGGFISDFATGVSDSLSTLFSGGSQMDSDKAFLSALGVDLTGSIYDTGKEAGDQMADGVKESDLPNAPGEALGSPEALEKVAESAEDLAKRVSEEMVAGIQSGMSDLDILAMINSQETAYNETFDRIFDYAGKSLRMHLSEGASGNYWSLFSGDTLLGQSFGGDAAAAFQAITGLPAPEEGAAAYYRLMGDAAEAERIEMLDALSEAPEYQFNFDIDKALSWSPTKERGAMYNMLLTTLNNAGTDAATESARTTAEEYGKALQEVDWANLPGLQAAAAKLKAAKGELYSGVGDKSWADLIDNQTDAYKDALMAQIADLSEFTKQTGQTLVESLKNVFSDVQLEQDERALIEAMEPQLELLKEKAPEEFRKAGLDSILAFVEAVKSGASTADLYTLLKTMFPEAAAASTSALQDVAKATNIASVGYNNLEKAVAECEECLMSDFGAWQEAQDNLFNPSYIGQGGQAYLDWKNSVVSSVTAASAAVQAAGGVALGAGAQPQSVTAKLNLDTSAATAAMSAFETTAKTDIKKPLTIDSSAATSAITTLDNSAKQSVTKPLTIDTSQAMGAIASINAAASAPVYKTVYVSEVYTGSSGGSDAGAGAGGGGGFGYSLPPIFMARGGYVSRPTLAVVGEAGPEYVIPAENMAKGLSRMGGGEVNITINSPIYGGGGQDAEALLAQRNKELVAEITAQISEARRGL